MMNQKKIFGFRIKKLRKDMGWTQENLAERMDITPNYLSSIEKRTIIKILHEVALRGLLEQMFGD